MRLRWVMGILVGLAAAGFLLFGGEGVHTEMPEMREPAVTPVVIQDEMQYVEKTDEPEPIVEVEKLLLTDKSEWEEKGERTPSAFVLAIRGSCIAVGCETSEAALKKRPGWLDTSATAIGGICGCWRRWSWGMRSRSRRRTAACTAMLLRRSMWRTI